MTSNSRSYSNSRVNIRVVLWGLIILYTLLLPNAIVVYRALVGYVGETITGKIPLISVLLFGSIYAFYGYRKNKNFRHVLFLIPSAVIAALIIRLEPNPNKHIHIPEYVLIAWLLYSVLSKDYQGGGIFILIWLCGSLLGVVDELEQGIHPRRFYGWSDMLVNSASSLIGIMTLIGVVGEARREWRWTTGLKNYRYALALLLFGVVAAIIMGVILFQVQTHEAFWGVYPVWLLAGNILYLAGLLWAIAWNTEKLWRKHQRSNATAHLWLIPLLVIIAYMHALIIFVALSGVGFR